MPEMDGLEATRAIVQRWPDGARPRIVAMTANAMQGDRERCLDAGMDDYVTKPIRPDELVAVNSAAPPRPRHGRRRPPGGPATARSWTSGTFRRFAETMGADDPGFVRQGSIDEFLVDAPALICSIQEGQSPAFRDADTARRAAHTLKSNANTFGAHELGRRSADLEALAKGGDLDAAGSSRSRAGRGMGAGPYRSPDGLGDPHRR